MDNHDTAGPRTQSGPCPVGNVNEPKDFALQFEGMRAKYLPVSGNVVVASYVDGERVASARVLTLPEDKQDIFHQSAVMQLAKAYAHAINSGVTQEQCEQLVSHGRPVADQVSLESVSNLGYELKGALVHTPAHLEYAMHNPHTEQLVLITPDVSARCISEYELIQETK